jgi:hypothetical protein
MAIRFSSTSTSDLTRRPRLRQALLAIGVIVLLWLAWTGLSGGVTQLSQAQTPGQVIQTGTQFAYGLFALLSVVTTFWASRWNLLMLAGWTVSAALAGGLAAVVWGGASLLTGYVAGGAALLIGLGIAWLLRAGASSLTRL